MNSSLYWYRMWTKVQFVVARSTVAARCRCCCRAAPRRAAAAAGGTAATGGEENGVCRTSLRPCRQHCLKLCRLFIRVCVLSAVVSEQRCVDWLESVWLGVKVYLTTLPGSEQQTVPQPPHVASVLEFVKVIRVNETRRLVPLGGNLVSCQL